MSDLIEEVNGMVTEFVYVPVPGHLVGDVMRLVIEDGGTSLPPRRRQKERTSNSEQLDPLQNERYPDLVAEMTDEEVRDAYRHGSRLQRRIWEELAKHPGEPILFGELSERLGVSHHAVPASIGRYLDRAKAQYEDRRPHHESVSPDRTQWWIWLDERVSRLITDEAGRGNDSD